MTSKLLIAFALATSAAVAVAAALWVAGSGTSAEARVHRSRRQLPAVVRRSHELPLPAAVQLAVVYAVGERRKKKMAVVCVGCGRSIGILVRPRTARRPRVARAAVAPLQAEKLDGAEGLPASTPAMIPSMAPVPANALQPPAVAAAAASAPQEAEILETKDSEALVEELYEMFAATESEEQLRAAFAASARQLSVHFRFDQGTDSDSGDKALDSDSDSELQDVAAALARAPMSGGAEQPGDVAGIQGPSRAQEGRRADGASSSTAQA